MPSIAPSFAVIAAVRADIIGALKSGNPPDVIAAQIAPSLFYVNQWASQIPLLLAGSGPGSCLDLVFTIRKDLFVPPAYTQLSFGTLVGDQPESFQVFTAFVRDIISAQKAEKPVQKVRFLYFNFNFELIFIFSFINVPAPSSLKLLLMMMTSQRPYQ